MRTLLRGNDYSGYDVAAQPDGSLKLTMKQAAIRGPARRARWIRRLRRFASASTSWGCAEPVIQKYGLGENQILVELPGVDDPARVEDVIQSTAKLEIHAVDRVGPLHGRPGGAGRR